MNKYVVGYLSLFDGQLKQELVLANSKFEAVVSYLGLTEDDIDGITTLEGLYELVENMDAFINVLNLDAKTYKKNSTPCPRFWASDEVIEHFVN